MTRAATIVLVAIESETCAYWLTDALARELEARSQGDDMLVLATTLLSADAVPVTRTPVDSVLLADLVTTLACMGLPIPSGQQNGNRGRGLPGVVLIRLGREEARSLGRHVDDLLRSTSVPQIASHDAQILFADDVDAVGAGLDYLRRALEVPESHAYVVLRLN